MNDDMIQEDIGESKPSFIMSDETLLLNLHNAAVAKAASIVNLNAKGKEINQHIINSYCNDGKFIRNDTVVDIANPNNVSTVKFSSFDVAIVLEEANLTNLKDEKLLADAGKLKIQRQHNEKLLKSIKKMILAGINEYFNWFCGEKNKISEDDLVLFIPNWSGGRIPIKKNGEGCELVGLEGKELEYYMSMFDPSYTASPSSNEIDKMVNDPGFKKRIGYRVGYTMV